MSWPFPSRAPRASRMMTSLSAGLQVMEREPDPDHVGRLRAVGHGSDEVALVELDRAAQRLDRDGGHVERRSR